MKKIIDLHLDGEKLAFNDAREQTTGQRSECIVTIQPGKNGPPAHRHVLQTEGFKVLSGQMIAVVNGKKIVAKEGETIIVNPNESHTFKNGSYIESLVMTAWYEPALHIEWVLQTLGEDAMKNGGSWSKCSKLLAMFLMYQTRREYRLVGMPNWVQDLLFGLGAGIATWTGAVKKVQVPTGLA